MLRKAVTVIGAATLLLMMTYTVLNVIIRSTVGTPLPAAIELTTRWWMVPMVFSGWVIAHLAREHIIVDFVVDNAGSRVRTVMAAVNGILLILFLALVTYAGLQGALENQARSEYGVDTGWPIWVTRYLVPGFAVLFIGYILHDGWRWIANHRGGGTAVTAQQSSGQQTPAEQTGAGHDS